MYINKLLVVLGVLASINYLLNLPPSTNPVAGLAGLAIATVLFSYLWLGIRRAAEGVAAHVRETEAP